MVTYLCGAFIRDSIDDFDNHVDDMLRHIIGSNFSMDDRMVIGLPLSMGGLGVPKAADIADLAFVSSVGASWPLQPQLEIRQGFNDIASALTLQFGIKVPALPSKIDLGVSPLTTLFKKEFRQAKFMLDANVCRRNQILSQANIQRKVTIEGRSCMGANFWLTVSPNRFRGSSFEPASFRSLLRFHLSMPLLSQQVKCPDCGKAQDRFRIHALSCKVASGAIDQHDSIVNGIVESLHLKPV